MTNINFRIIFILLSFTACFRVGIPERFYSYQINEDKITSINYPYVYIAIPSRIESYGLDESKSDQILGHQFILGFLPFTSLYLEHGVNSLYLEALVQHCHSQGIVPVIVSKKLSDLYHLNAIEFSGDLNLTVYDLLFSRLIDIDGQLLVSGQEVKIAESELYVQAQYPLIGHVMQTNILAALSKKKFLVSNKKIVGDRGVVPVVIPLPSADLLSESILSEFAQAYGDSNGIFTAYMFSRIMQRGAEAGAEASSGIEPVALAANYSSNESFNNLSQLKIKLEKLQISDKLNLSLEYLVSGQGFICSLSEEIDYSRDGALNVALEQAVKKTTYALLSKDRKICEPVIR